jgi:hypothetical protein
MTGLRLPLLLLAVTALLSSAATANAENPEPKRFAVSIKIFARNTAAAVEPELVASGIFEVTADNRRRSYRLSWKNGAERPVWLAFANYDDVPSGELRGNLRVFGHISDAEDGSRDDPAVAFLYSLDDEHSKAPIRDLIGHPLPGADWANSVLLKTSHLQIVRDESGRELEFAISATAA